ncbi:MAG: transposase [Thaumarchaeota archaeon]|nr:transposase [Nitrososphaerota archaeon]
MLRTYSNTIPKVPDYTTIHKRINRLDIKVDPDLGNNDIVIAIDSTGIKVVNRGGGCVTNEIIEGISEDICRC